MPNNPASTLRVFCAVEVSQAARQLILQHIRRLRACVPDAKASWSREANIHLTLKFLGEIPTSSVASFSDAAARATAGVASFAVQCEHAGVFPNLRQPRVLWVGIHGSSGGLQELHARLENEAAKAGFARDGRPFHPHLTVARLRQPQNARTLATAHQQLGFAPVEIPVSELLVIRSELSSAGSKYSVISKHKLQG
jgi:2'-5' RNA ligase